MGVLLFGSSQGSGHSKGWRELGPIVAAALWHTASRGWWWCCCCCWELNGRLVVLSALNLILICYKYIQYIRIYVYIYISKYCILCLILYTYTLFCTVLPFTPPTSLTLCFWASAQNPAEDPKSRSPNPGLR